MNIYRIRRKLRSCFHFFNAKANISYSQAGEDILIDYFFQQTLKKKDPSYLDIGTNDPLHGNNTYLFYLRKCKGVCIEPDPLLYKKILAKRPHDTILNAGVGTGEESAGLLYTFPEPYTGWNTFSKQEAEIRQKETGVNYSTGNAVNILPLNKVIEDHFPPGGPDFISIDVEGLDLVILQTLDFTRFQPKLICVETISFSTSNKEVKQTAIGEFLVSKGYFSYGDTHINTLFVRKDIFNK